MSEVNRSTEYALLLDDLNDIRAKNVGHMALTALAAKEGDASGKVMTTLLGLIRTPHENLAVHVNDVLDTSGETNVIIVVTDLDGDRDFTVYGLGPHAGEEKGRGPMDDEAIESLRDMFRKNVEWQEATFTPDDF